MYSLTLLKSDYLALNNGKDDERVHCMVIYGTVRLCANGVFMQKIAILNQNMELTLSAHVSHFTQVQDESHEEIIERLDLIRMKKHDSR